MNNDEAPLSKQAIRLGVASVKRKFSGETLQMFSKEVISRLEQTEAFVNARSVLLYFSMADEVNTQELIEKYIGTKHIVLPVVRKDDLMLRELKDAADTERSPFGILEPKSGEYLTDYSKIDLAVIPGVAFDVKLHRLGRGKGYYDRLLANMEAPRIGICFDFQLYDAIPFDAKDVPMDAVVTQGASIWGKDKKAAKTFCRR